MSPDRIPAHFNLSWKASHRSAFGYFLKMRAARPMIATISDQSDRNTDANQAQSDDRSPLHGRRERLFFAAVGPGPGFGFAALYASRAALTEDSVTPLPL